MPRTTLVTGVSRRRGIGFAIAQRLLRDDGARVVAHSYPPYDATQPWGADPDGINAVLTALGGESDRLAHAEADLADPSAPERLVGHAIKRLGNPRCVRGQPRALSAGHPRRVSTTVLDH